MHTTTVEMICHLIDMAHSRDLPRRIIKPAVWQNELRWDDFAPMNYRQVKYWITRAVHQLREKEGV